MLDTRLSEALKGVDGNVDEEVTASKTEAAGWAIGAGNEREVTVRMTVSILDDLLDAYHILADKGHEVTGYVESAAGGRMVAMVTGALRWRMM